jgi:hypothetical protein
MIACMIALVLPSVFLYGGVFYSGHFFVLLIALTLGAWRALSCIGLPFFTLEPASHSPFDRKHGILTLMALIATAIVLDAFMSSKFDSDEARESERSASAIQQPRPLSR